MNNLHDFHSIFPWKTTQISRSLDQQLGFGGSPRLHLTPSSIGFHGMILYTIHIYIYIYMYSIQYMYIWYKYAIPRTLGRFHKFITFPSFGASEFIQNKILWSAAWVARSCCHKTIQLQTHPWNKNSYSMLHLASCNPPKKKMPQKRSRHVVLSLAENELSVFIGS